MITSGQKTYFPEIGKIEFEGKDSDNMLAFRYYQPDRMVGNKTMAEHFKFAVCYWHTFCGNGTDPFGAPTRNYEWDQAADPIQRAKDKMDAAFEFMTKLGVEYYCFHDVDIIDEAPSLLEFEKRLNIITDYALVKQKASGLKLLWGTANLFSNPRYMNGAITNPQMDIVAYAAAQVKNAVDATIKLGGENYVFWGGREGYLSLLNTDMQREIDHLGTFFNMIVTYARKNGFKGTFFIEPKPCEPSKHQYDFDSATTIGFIRQYGLENDFKLNVEVNHATLANHTFEHELQVAADAGMLGSIDANRGDYQNGWDTDQFPVDIYELTQTMMVILQAGGLQGGGVNFDAKVRRNSSDPADLFYAHIGGMDLFARALLTAHDILENSPYRKAFKERYESFDSGIGQQFENGLLSVEQLADYAAGLQAIKVKSGRQEWFENLINRYI